MNYDYTTYLNEIKSDIKHYDAFSHAKKMLPMVRGLKQLANEKAALLSEYAKVDQALSDAIDYTINSPTNLQAFLAATQADLKALDELKEQLNGFSRMEIPTDFALQVSNLIKSCHQIYPNEIGEKIQATKQLQQTIQDHKTQKEAERKALQKKLLKLSAIGAAVLIALYAIVYFVVPFLMAYWWVFAIVLGLYIWSRLAQ